MLAPRKERRYTSMWNPWALCVFVLFYHGKWRQTGLRLRHHLSLSCFVNKVMTSWYYVVKKSSIIGLRSASGLSVSCAKHYQKDYNVTKSTFTCSKPKRTALQQGLKSVQSWKLRHQNDGIFVVPLSLLITLELFYTLL